MESRRRSSMITCLLTTLIVSTASLNTTIPSLDITRAIQEMQRASYFTFVTLLSMVLDEIPHNTTFLMPSDRALSKVSIPPNTTLEFLLRHSIRAPLTFDDLSRFPTGATILTYQQGYSLEIVNKGRREFYLNNVQLVCPDVCVAGSLFRCHGIYGVLEAETKGTTPTCMPMSPPSNGSAGPSPIPSPPLLPPSGSSPSLIPAISPSPVESNDGSTKSDSSARICQGAFTTAVLSMALLVLKVRV